MILEKLKEKYVRLFPNDGEMSSEEIKDIEIRLNLNFPNAFKEIMSFYLGGKLGNRFLLNFQTIGNYSIEEETLALRKAINLPHDFLVLYCEYGMIYMDCNPQSPKYGHVMYVGNEDAQCLGDGIKPEYYWDYPTFTDFFSYLLDEEEKERAAVE